MRGRFARQSPPPKPAWGRAHFRALMEHALATASHRTSRPHYYSCALGPRVRLQISTRPIGRCRRHTRARVLLCRSGTHGEGRPTRLVVTRTLPHDALRMRPSRPLSRTSRVAFQAQPLLAATKAVRSIAVRVGVSGGARECTREYELRANHPPRGRLFGVFFYQNPICRQTSIATLRAQEHARASDMPSLSQAPCISMRG